MDADVPDRTNLSFHLLGMIASPLHKSGTRWENRDTPDSPDFSAFIPDDRDIYGIEFSLVGKIWDGRETAKSQTVWDFPDM